MRYDKFRWFLSIVSISCVARVSSQVQQETNGTSSDIFCLPEGWPCLSLDICCATANFVPLECRNSFCAKVTPPPTPPPTTMSPTLAPTSAPPSTAPVPTSSPTAVCSVKDGPCTMDSDCCSGFLCNTLLGLNRCYNGICASMAGDACSTQGDCCPTFYCDNPSMAKHKKKNNLRKLGKKGEPSRPVAPPAPTAPPPHPAPTAPDKSTGTCQCQSEGACNAFLPCCFGIPCINNWCVPPTSSPTSASPTDFPTSSPTTASPTNAQDEPQTVPPTIAPPTGPSAPSIFDTLRDRADVSVTFRLVQGSDTITSLLQDPATTVTIFAPTNDAIEMFADTIPSNLLGQVLSVHIFEGEFTSTALLALAETGGSITSLLGFPNPLTSTDGMNLSISGAPIVVADIAASNGLIHIIDGQLIPGFGNTPGPSPGSSSPTAPITSPPTALSPTASPTTASSASPTTSNPTMQPTSNPTAMQTSNPTAMQTSNPTAMPTPIPTAALLSIFDLLSARSDVTATFGLVGDSPEITALLQGPGALTIFAPSDAAIATLAALIPANFLTTVLNLHIFDGIFSSTDLLDLAAANGSLVSREGGPNPITTEGDNIVILNAPVVVADIQASNGVVHVIDGQLIPGFGGN